MKKIYGLEAILVQKNSIIPRVIEETFNDLIKLAEETNSEVDEKELSKRFRVLSEFLSKEINVTIDVVNSNWVTAHCHVYYWNENHVLSSNTVTEKHNYKEILDFLKSRKGGLDRKNVRVDGYLSKTPIMLVLNFNLLYRTVKLSAKELTAVLLHELGHGWSIMEYSDRMQSVNQVLAEALQNTVANKKFNHEYVLKLAEEADMISKVEYEEMLKSNSRFVKSLPVLQLFTQKVINLTNSAYIRTSNEALADNFATKFGYGRELVTGLYKLHRAFNQTAVYSEYGTYLGLLNTLFTTLRLMGMLIALIVAPGIFIALPATLAALTVMPWIVAAYIGMFVGLLGNAVTPNLDVDTNPEYDTAKRRNQRIRNTIVNELKQESDKKYLTQYLEQLDEIDKYINMAYEHKTMWKWLKLTFSQKARTEDMQMREEQMLEDLIANDLYISAAKLKLKYA